MRSLWGQGVNVISMNFLPDVYVQCDVCKGKRYDRETLQVRYKNHTISDVLEMTIEEAKDLFSAVPPAVQRLQSLVDVGLGYMRLGQSAPTLSGGEAQRMKLATELSKRPRVTPSTSLTSPQLVSAFTMYTPSWISCNAWWIKATRLL